MTMKLHLYLLSVISFFLAAKANAQIYKCTFIDDVTRQNKVVYTDAQCGKAQKQTLTAIQAKSRFNLQTSQTPLTTQLAQANAVDSAVMRAILSRNFKLAQSLATTKEHWRLISIAEGEAAQPLIVANSQSRVSREEECADAKYNFE